MPLPYLLCRAESKVTDLRLVYVLGIIKCGENPSMGRAVREKSTGKKKEHFYLTSCTDDSFSFVL